MEDVRDILQRNFVHASVVKKMKQKWHPRHQRPANQE